MQVLDDACKRYSLAIVKTELKVVSGRKPVDLPSQVRVRVSCLVQQFHWIGCGVVGLCVWG